MGTISLSNQFGMSRWIAGAFSGHTVESDQHDFNANESL